MKIYGIPNCNTVKKALDWLKENHLNFEFHDFKKLGIEESKLKEWADQVGWETLINKRGTTWKKLDIETQLSISNESAAFQLMQQKPSIIKRPLIEHKGSILQGFDADAYEKHFKV